MAMIAAPPVRCTKVVFARWEADRDVGTHPSWQPRCDKCEAGLIFQAYRCLNDPSHWHIGHGDPREWEMGEAMVTMNVVDLPDARSAPLRGGDRWCAVSAGGKGQPVEILSVNDVHVYFRAIARGVDGSQKFKLQHAAFRTRYAPLKLADDRQKRLALAARRGEAPSPVVIPEPVDEMDDPISVAVEAVVGEQWPEPTVVPATTPAPSPWEALRPRRPSGPPPKLSAEQAREIWQLRQDGVNGREIARTYGISEPTVINIAKGRNYAWATADLRAAIEQQPAPPAPQQEEPAVQIVTPPTEPVPPLEAVTWVQRAREQQTLSPLVSEMADALDVLVEYAGRPLPKYLKLDLDAIRGLVEQARSA